MAVSKLRRDVSKGRAKIAHVGKNDEWRVVTTSAGPKGEFHHVQFRGQSWVHSPSLAAGVHACNTMAEMPFESFTLADRQKMIYVRRITTAYNPASL
ncbi:hypothetical protein BcepF1.005 [Burkholderia phage BcepF1]|uniref:Uncharacterized protein n=1 Tax=Burkholderia phage BcepF1 TaxID=2886897 RepID=A1YZQ9_9CAUD|nr:hypothetical protein BcepF1.005 [Burkholderia phage BcepF1]ABL96736.1 hypothetical protein BcepF1.005 [Burkholderia phage BcepF1]